MGKIWCSGSFPSSAGRNITVFTLFYTAYKSLIEVLWVHSCSSMHAMFMFISYSRVKSRSQEGANLKSRWAPLRTRRSRRTNQTWANLVSFLKGKRWIKALQPSESDPFLRLHVSSWSGWLLSVNTSISLPVMRGRACVRVCQLPFPSRWRASGWSDPEKTESGRVKHHQHHSWNGAKHTQNRLGPPKNTIWRNQTTFKSLYSIWSKTILEK